MAVRLLFRKFVGQARLFGAACVVLLLAGCSSITHRPFTFVQMCDPQLGFGGYQDDVTRFRQAVDQINRLKPDFVVICGDLVNGVNPKPCADFDALKARFKMPCYCAPGNHDVGNTPTANSLKRYRAWQGRDYFSFEHKGFTFVVVNSQLWKTPLSGETEKQDAWLKDTLATAVQKASPVFIVDHHPLFEHQPDEPDDYYNLPVQTRQSLLELFERSGVVAILGGHTHKTLTLDYHGIQMVTGEVTSRNFDKRPLGFRLWHVGSRRPYKNDFVPLQQK